MLPSTHILALESRSGVTFQVTEQQTRLSLSNIEKILNSKLPRVRDSSTFPCVSSTKINMYKLLSYTYKPKIYTWKKFNYIYVTLSSHLQKLYQGKRMTENLR